jgi:hypothetical protein
MPSELPMAEGLWRLIIRRREKMSVEKTGWHSVAFRENHEVIFNVPFTSSQNGFLIGVKS